MLELARILKDHQNSGALNAQISLHAALDDHTWLTKSGGLIQFLAIDGIDYECLDASRIDQAARRFESAIRSFDENFRIYQYLIKRRQESVPARDYPDAVVHEAVASRKAHLESMGAHLFSVEVVFAVVYEGWSIEPSIRERVSTWLSAPGATLRRQLSNRHAIQAHDQNLDRARDLLQERVAGFVVQLPEGMQATVLDKGQAYRFLRGLLNYSPLKRDAVRLQYDQFVDFQACDSTLECHRDHLRLDDYFVQALTLKEPPAQTVAHLLREFQELRCEWIVATEWKRTTNQAMRRLIQSKRRHFHNSKTSLMSHLGSGPQTSSRDLLVDDSAVSQVGELGVCLQELEVKGHVFGSFSLTALVFDQDRAAVRRAAADCFKVFATHDAQLTEERYNLLNAFLAVLPGNSAHNLRRLWLLDSNYADLSFLFTAYAGEAENRHLGTEHLAVLETNHRTPYFFNLHYHDVAHTLILGATGSGKSFLLNFLLTHLQKYQPLTYIFDLGGGYENLTRLFGGAHLALGSEALPAINPFALPPTAANRQFLFALVRVLLESAGYRLTGGDEQDLHEQIENLYLIEPDQRRLLTLSNMLSRTLRAQLQRWVQGGAFGTLFDNVTDTLTLASFQSFDFAGMSTIPELLEPLLFYILHRATASIHDPASTTLFKTFVIDEAWRFFRHPAIRAYILEALKTWRKANAAMVLATQSSDDLLRSELLNVIVESCPTQIFLANPGMDRQSYRETFHLNETETELIANLVPKQQLLLKRPDRSKVLNLNVGPRDYWIYTSSPFERERRREVIARHGLARGLDILAHEPHTQQGVHS